jgi:hypothetical protein
MPMLEGFRDMGPGELDGDQTAQGNTGFTQVWPPSRVKTYVLLV